MRKDPLPNYRFLIEIDGMALAFFRGASGLSTELEVQTQREGGRNAHDVKLPGQGSLGHVTLMRGYAAETAFFTWIRQASDLGRSPASIRRAVDLVVVTDDRTERLRYSLLRAWPVKWSLVDKEGSAAEVDIESIELAFEGLTRGREAVPSGAGGLDPFGSGLAALRRAAVSRAAEVAGRAVSDSLNGVRGAVNQVAGQAQQAAQQAGSQAQQAAAQAQQAAAQAQQAAAQAQQAALDQVEQSPLAQAFSQGATSASASAASSQQAVAQQMAQGSVAPTVADGPASASALAGRSTDGFAAQGEATALAAQPGPVWSDGVHAVQPPEGFAEPALPSF